MSRITFLSYATPAFEPARDALCQSARAVGFDAALALGPADLDPAFRDRNAEILSQPRGGGYWLWKPQIILQALRRMGPDEMLVYSDAGRSGYYRFRRMPERLIARCRRDGFLPGVALRQHGPMSAWTKRDAFVRLGMDTPEAHAAPVIQATWTFWTPTPAAFDFLEEWLAACEDPACLTDAPNCEGLPNLPDFRDHRHDQSLCSLVALRRGSPCLDYSDTAVFPILALRPRSQLSHHFFKRIEDAEALERGWSGPALLRSFIGLKARRS